MATSIDTTTARMPARRSRLRGRWIEDWEPEDEVFWEASGRRVARKNLVFSIFAEYIGFCVWVLWTIVVLNLGNAGYTLSVPELFWLTAAPTLVGAALRIPYTFAVPRFGGRLWTGISAALLLIPCLLLAIVVPSEWLLGQSHETQFWVLLACAATAGVGGGNFSSSMANISFFYPDGKKGLPLGLNAAGGNLGVAVAQLLVPLVIVIGVPMAAVKRPEHQVHLAYAGLMMLPFIVVAMIGAWLYMDSLAAAKADTSAYASSLRNPQTWIMSLLYIGTFGSFIGFSFALPLVIKNTFPEFLASHSFIATYLAGLSFVGALIGSVARPLGGWLSDRVGGARVTLACFAGLALCTIVAIVGVTQRSFAVFFGSFMVVFLLSGIGNGSTYRMITAIFAVLGERATESQPDGRAARLGFKRQAAAVVGIAGAIGAFGGFVIQLVLREASLGVANLVKLAETPAEKIAVAQSHADWAVPALGVFLGAYVVLGGVTWFFYLRRSFLTERVPSLAHASV